MARRGVVIYTATEWVGMSKMEIIQMRCSVYSILLYRLIKFNRNLLYSNSDT